MDVRDIFYGARSGAGRRAHRRFLELRRRWRRRALRMPSRVAIVLGLVLLVADASIQRDPVSWSLGFVLGTFMTFCLFVGDSPPPHIENWRTGAHGERRTAAALAPLRRHGWILFHDLPWGRAGGQRNLDHVVVGPGGVYLLDTKWLGGTALVEEDVVRLIRKDDPGNSYSMDRLAPSIRARAAALKQEIAQPELRWVQGVVVFWNDLRPPVVNDGNPVYVSGERLREWLLGRPHELDEHQIRRIAQTLAQGFAPEAESGAGSARRARRLSAPGPGSSSVR